MGFHPKRPIPPVFCRYQLLTQMTNSGGRGSLYVEVDMRVEVEGGPVGEIDQREVVW